MAGFDDQGNYLLGNHSQVKPKRPNPKSERGGRKEIDTSGRLPSGEPFQDISELKTILTTTQRHGVVRNIVHRTMSDALCRKLEVYDQPTVTEIIIICRSSFATSPARIWSRY